uniref:Proline-rich protein n=1 Tax=Oncorhynchus mykiss TaxID=8022 RepID=Q7LZ43_ONCMY
MTSLQLPSSPIKGTTARLNILSINHNAQKTQILQPTCPQAPPPQGVPTSSQERRPQEALDRTGRTYLTYPPPPGSPSRPLVV